MKLVKKLNETFNDLVIKMKAKRNLCFLHIELVAAVAILFATTLEPVHKMLYLIQIPKLLHLFKLSLTPSHYFNRTTRSIYSCSKHRHNTVDKGYLIQS